MAHTRLLVRTVTLVIASLTYASIATASPEDDSDRHIRTTDARLRGLVQQGSRISQTFRALVDRIERSDVVVYLRCDADLSQGMEGRLTFLSSAGGRRYVLVRLRHRTSVEYQLAIIAHELRHAVEIADAPTIIDASSLIREYRRIGYENLSAGRGLAFDSDAAIDAGNRVLRELSAAAAD